MVLYINTKDQKQVTVVLKEGDKVVESLSEENEYGSQVLLPLIEKLLKKYSAKSRLNNVQNPEVSSGIHLRGGNVSAPRDIDWEVLEGIEVETGPGSFTGLRVGVSVANALGFSLGLKVNGKKMETDLIY